MPKNKIINGQEINLINLFKFINSNKIAILIIFLISFAFTFALKTYSTNKYRFTIKLVAADKKFSDNYIFFNTLLKHFNQNHNIDLQNIIFNNFYRLSKNNKHFDLYLKNKEIEDKNIKIKILSTKHDGKYSSFIVNLYHPNYKEGKKLFISFINFLLLKAQDKTINDLEYFLNELKKDNYFKIKDSFSKEKFVIYLSIYNDNNLELIIKELKKIINLKKNDSFSDQELFNYVKLFKKENINDWFSFHSSKIIVSDLKDKTLSLLTSIIVGFISVIIYLILLAQIQSLRNKR